MPFPEAIQEALANYDQRKGFWRRLFRRDQAAIRALRSLNETDQSNHFKLYHCFIENLPRPIQASYQVYQTLLTYLEEQNLNDVPKITDQLCTAKIFESSYLEKLNKLEAKVLQALAKIVEQLHRHELLTKANFNAIEEVVPKEFNNIAQAVNTLNDHHCLNQDNFNAILKKPPFATNMAIILIALKETNLLTAENLRRLEDDSVHQFLLSPEARESIWEPLKDYLTRLLITQPHQLIFERIIELGKNENPIVNIEKYLNDLNSDIDYFSRKLSQRCSTLPRISSQPLLEPDQIASNKFETL
jgi:hypothetical protein